MILTLNHVIAWFLGMFLRLIVLLWVVSFIATSLRWGKKRGVRSKWIKVKERGWRKYTDERWHEDSYGRERGSSERVGRMRRENWIGKQQREGRGSQE